MPQFEKLVTKRTAHDEIIDHKLGFWDLSLLLNLTLVVKNLSTYILEFIMILSWTITNPWQHQCHKSQLPSEVSRYCQMSCLSNTKHMLVRVVLKWGNMMKCILYTLSVIKEDKQCSKGKPKQNVCRRLWRNKEKPCSFLVSIVNVTLTHNIWLMPYWWQVVVQWNEMKCCQPKDNGDQC